MKKVLAFASVALGLSAQAHAADLYEPAPAEPAPIAEPVVAAANGWYLRGDVSYDLMRLKGAHYFQGSNSNLHDFDSAKLDNTGNLGVGVGYQIDEHLRVDTTLDYLFSAKFRGSTSGTCGNSGNACTSSDVSALSAWGLMANAYVDIGHWGIVTPYLGAGIGGTYVKWDSLKNTNDDGTFEHHGRESWRFTYALMAGASVDITCNLKADVGYRYRHVAGGNMFGYRLNGGPGYDKGFDIHEGRAGLRYNFGGCEEAAYLPPAEIPQQPAVFK
ncbi:outer membrane protein [Rhizobium alvei]|uniref:Porin family protein n=1 Tax=Rhizobium alvei TaxID=1132659 RepID=A0ABT8YLY0_9HYPH|nr:outer membrane protein [Rhizobium alvei]MDO6964506.1 porin family protein [Rhizobium alvei]